MKTRASFVSNSSSSSFIVAFPYQPNSEEDCLEIMFNGVKQEFACDYNKNSTTTTTAIAFRVYQDILIEYSDKYNPEIKSLDDIIINELSNLYYWTDSIYFKYNKKNDLTEETGFVYSQNPFWAPDKELLKKLKKLIAESESINTYDLEVKIIGQRPSYALRGCNKFKNYYKNNKYIQEDLGPYSEEEILAYEKFEKKKETFWKSPEYKTIQKRRQTLWDQIKEVKKQLAVKQWEAIKKAYPDHFFFVVSYADENGDALMEHGHIFKNVFHIQISHH